MSGLCSRHAHTPTLLRVVKGVRDKRHSPITQSVWISGLTPPAMVRSRTTHTPPGGDVTVASREDARIGRRERMAEAQTLERNIRLAMAQAGVNSVLQLSRET